MHRPVLNGLKLACLCSGAKVPINSDIHPREGHQSLPNTYFDKFYAFIRDIGIDRFHIRCIFYVLKPSIRKIPGKSHLFSPR
jgi:hypothetical protein